MPHFQEAKKQWAAFQGFIPHRHGSQGAAARGHLQPSTLGSSHQQQKAKGWLKLAKEKTDMTTIILSKKASGKRSWHPIQASEGAPSKEGASYIRFSIKPSGNRFFNPTANGPLVHIGFQRTQTSMSAHQLSVHKGSLSLGRPVETLIFSNPAVDSLQGTESITPNIPEVRLEDWFLKQITWKPCKYYPMYLNASYIQFTKGTDYILRLIHQSSMGFYLQ